MTEVFTIITGKLYQSGEPDKSTVKSFDSVLNLIEPDDQLLPFQHYKHWPIEDGPLPDLGKLKEAVDWVLGEIRLGRKVLIHCAAGINRSGLVNALVVKSLMGITGKAAVAFIRQQRPGALTNQEFATYVESL